MKRFILLLFLITAPSAFGQCTNTDGSLNNINNCPGPVYYKGPVTSSQGFVGVLPGVDVTSPPYNALCNGIANDTSAIQAAINSGAGIVNLPARSCLISTALSVTGKGVILAGKGMGVSRIVQTTLTADGVDFVSPPALAGGGLRDLTIASNVADGQHGSTGTALSVSGANDNFVAQNFDLDGFDTGLKVLSDFQATFINFTIRNFSNAGILIPDTTSPGAGNIFQAGNVSNIGYAGNNSASIGIQVQVSGGDFWDTIDVTATNTGWLFQPITSAHTIWDTWISNCLADTTLTNGWVLDGSIGNIVNWKADKMWGAFSAGGSGFVALGNLVGGGTQTSGLDDVTIENSDFRQNFQYGAHLEGGANIRFVSTRFTGNSWGNGNSFNYDGILIDSGVSNYKILNSWSGAFGLGGPGNPQRYGLNIASGAAPTAQIENNDFTGNQNVANIAVTQSNMQMQGNSPLGTLGLNISSAVTLDLNPNSALTANTSVYLGRNGQQANFYDTAYMASSVGYISSILMDVDTAPGVGQTITYQLYKNGSSIGSSATISGATATQVIFSPQAQLAANDTIAVQVVTSSGAATARHRGYMLFQP